MTLNPNNPTTLTRREALAAIGGAAAAALAPKWSFSQATRPAKPPNLLWIITDQQHVD